MEKLTAKIENWSVVDNLIFNGFRDLEPGQRLTGYLMGHTDLPNGVIYTSVIKSIDKAKGLVETGNTVYQLGQINEPYENWAESAHASQQSCVPAFVPDPRKPVTAYPVSVPAFRQG